MTPDEANAAIKALAAIRDGASTSLRQAEAAVRALRDLADDLETASRAAGTPGERQGLLTAARFARAKAEAMSR